LYFDELKLRVLHGVIWTLTLKILSFQRLMEKVDRTLLKKHTFSIVEYLKMNTQSQKKRGFFIDHSTEILHKNLQIRAFLHGG